MFHGIILIKSDMKFKMKFKKHLRGKDENYMAIVI
jgi:hypothetical protein